MRARSEETVRGFGVVGLHGDGLLQSDQRGENLCTPLLLAARRGHGERGLEVMHAGQGSVRVGLADLTASPLRLAELS
jgi:hypothetical protein